MFEGEKMDSMCIRSVSKELDGFLAGGLHKGMITQVYGEAGSGKSQLAMLYMLGVCCVGGRPFREGSPYAICPLRRN